MAKKYQKLYKLDQQKRAANKKKQKRLSKLSAEDRLLIKIFGE